MRQTWRMFPESQRPKSKFVSSTQHAVPLRRAGLPARGLQLPSGIQPEAMWRGIRTSCGGDFPVWAKVRVTRERDRVIVAIDNIPSGKPIQQNQVRLETV